MLEAWTIYKKSVTNKSLILNIINTNFVRDLAVSKKYSKIFEIQFAGEFVGPMLFSAPVLCTRRKHDHEETGTCQGALVREKKRSYICALQGATRGYLKKATAMRPNAIFFSQHCGAKPQNYGIVLACFSLSCNPGAISLSRVAFHMGSETRRFAAKTLWYVSTRFRILGKVLSETNSQSWKVRTVLNIALFCTSTTPRIESQMKVTTHFCPQ